ncbi:MAG TPA: membrane protein insertion efficiency factor YidD [Terriglobales bacterium]|nr:membrane protein insertion efficiency factor YidD [Terriglobales bacterium]
MMRLRTLPQRAALACLRAYRQWLSPWLPPACRFYPTCSGYALEAIERFGLLRGGWLAARRLGRCHPFHPGGFDPVPERPAHAAPPAPPKAQWL